MVTTVRIGETFDSRYKIIEHLGSGGIGSVFKALQVDCDRVIAIKVLHDYTADDSEYRARFVNEAQALSQVQHQNIVNVYHLGVGPVEIPYMAMEYLDGKSVRAMLNSGKLPSKQALQIIRDAALALDFCHKRNIVHRDLKPENMIIIDKPAANTVKLVDFGLAKVIKPTDQKLTSTGELIGTSSYMSPEQCKGQPVDYRSDIYSLSVCLFELLTGEKPFNADTSIGMLYEHMNSPTPVIVRSQVDIFSEDFNRIIQKGMAKDPSARFASMAELAKEIELALADIEDPSKSNRVQKIVVAVGVLALVAVCSFWFLGANNRTKSAGGTENKKKSINSLDKKEKEKRTDLERSEKRYGRSSPEIVSKLVDLAEYYESIQRAGESESLLKRAVTIKETELGDSNPGIVTYIWRLAVVYQSEGKLNEAAEQFNRVLQVEEKSLGPNNQNVQGAMVYLVQDYSKLGRFKAAEPLLKRMLEAQRTTLGNENSLLAQSLFNLAQNYQNQGKYAEAEPLFKESLAIKEANLGLENREIASSLCDLAQIYRLQHKFKDAEPLYDRALKIRKEAFGAESQEVAFSIFDIAENYRSQGRFKEAQDLFFKALKMDEQLGSSQAEADMVRTLTYCARTYLDQRKFTDAEPLLRRALSIQQNKQTAGWLDECYRRENKQADAEKLERQLNLTTTNK